MSVSVVIRWLVCSSGDATVGVGGKRCLTRISVCDGDSMGSTGRDGRDVLAEAVEESDREGEMTLSIFCILSSFGPRWSGESRNVEVHPEWKLKPGCKDAAESFVQSSRSCFEGASMAFCLPLPFPSTTLDGRGDWDENAKLAAACVDSRRAGEVAYFLSVELEMPLFLRKAEGQGVGERVGFSNSVLEAACGAVLLGPAILSSREEPLPCISAKSLTPLLASIA